MMVDYIIEKEQPFTMSDCNDFTYLIQGAFQPQHKSFSRNTTRNKITKKHSDMKKELLEIFSNLNGIFFFNI